LLKARRLGDELPDCLHDLVGLLLVRVVTGALDDPEARPPDLGRQLTLSFRREHEVVTSRNHQVGTVISPRRSITVQPLTRWRKPKI
jgi:hypothetical protein